MYLGSVGNSKGCTLTSAQITQMQNIKIYCKSYYSSQRALFLIECVVHKAVMVGVCDGSVHKEMHKQVNSIADAHGPHSSSHAQHDMECNMYFHSGTQHDIQKDVLAVCLQSIQWNHQLKKPKTCFYNPGTKHTPSVS